MIEINKKTHEAEAIISSRIKHGEGTRARPEFDTFSHGSKQRYRDIKYDFSL